MKINWKPIPGYEDCYVVSDSGQVARVKTYGAKPKAVWKLLAPRIKNGGYVTFHLCQDGIRKDPVVHRMVWEAFCGPIPDGLEINHKNGIKTDNSLANLEVVTRSENHIHRYRVLNHPAPNNPSPGSRNGCSKLSERDIPEIVRLYQSGLRQKDIGKEYGVSQRMISLILRGEKWQHVKRRHFLHSHGGNFSQPRGNISDQN